MKKWKISRLKIENFKPFEDTLFDFRKAAMITLDGPNGFGKTSIFDALELLFTGSISRIKKINEATIAKNFKQKQFTENIYWNRSQLGDIAIKAELADTDTGENIILARIAETSELVNPANNSPDDFRIFKLYKLATLEPDSPREEVTADFLEEILGENFLKNFAILNYLEQGQNRYLYSKKANERKDGINHLINVEKLTNQISRLSDLEKHITSNFTGKEHVQIKNNLKEKAERLSKLIQDSSIDISYKRLSTASPTPSWDLQNPIFSDGEGDFEQLLNEVGKVKKIHANYEEVLTRRRNKSLDSFISKEADIKLALQIGSQIPRLEPLKNLNILLLNLKNDVELLQKPASNIDISDIAKFKTPVLLTNIEGLLTSRNELLSLNSDADQKLTALLNAQAHLLEKHQECGSIEDEKCPYCGFDWETKDSLLQAVEITASDFRSRIAESAANLERITNQLQQEANIELAKLKSKRDIESKGFDENLYKALIGAEVKFPTIQETLKTLSTYKIQPPPVYIPDSSEVDILFNAASDIILSSKTPEKDTLPENWSITLKVSFSEENGISLLSADDLDQKEHFLKTEYEKRNNKEYQETLTKFRAAEQILSAAEKTKNKVITLRKALDKTAQSYAKKTISDIELLFHIYSGRLIQNYQRGLGLFITSGKGDVLKFNTAEKSEHDAILSMSSGQIASLGMAFFLTLNRVYASNSFILIDDPVQSMDEINVASLSDLLRVELPDRQILLSNHELEVSTYMRYKFKRGGLSQASISMLKQQ
ncbi:MAG: AAA family ATPase [Pseudomonas sp.]|uniref:AAA family ATPase n=1 Tax=Pseudomonas sp. TaxID=306 RepID=UPI00273338B4|nr:AAA family ATPase [Pseudomonas sp.]MDP3845892.1 AAA family ATPase [Pseudomonas sp.]